jgi:hypothetical protein
MATKSGVNISFRQIHQPLGKPVKYLKSVQGIGSIDAGVGKTAQRLGVADQVLKAYK